MSCSTGTSLLYPKVTQLKVTDGGSDSCAISMEVGTMLAVLLAIFPLLFLQFPQAYDASSSPLQILHLTGDDVNWQR